MTQKPRFLPLLFLFAMLLLTNSETAQAQKSKIPNGAVVVSKTPKPNGPVSATSIAKLPQNGLIIGCFMQNKMPRPYPCEFRVTSMGIGGGGATLKDPAGFDQKNPAILTLHIGKASQNAFVTDDVRRLTFSLVMTVSRINKPSFSATGGYPLVFYPKDIAALMSDVWKTQTPLVFDYLVTTESMAISTDQTAVLMLPIKFMVKKDGKGGYGFLPPNGADPATPTQTGTFYWLNPATAAATSKQANTADMRDVAEWWAKVKFVLAP
jgi:hypothetical protein